jgi:two-component system, NarL family, sensor kinase
VTGTGRTTNVRLAAGGKGGDAFGVTRDRTVALAVLPYFLVGVVSIVALGIGSAYLLRHSSTTMSIRDAKDRAAIMATGIVQPEMPDGVLESAPAAVAALDAISRDRLIPSGAARVKLWDRTGTIVYSDEHRLIGKRYGLEPETRGVLAGGGAYADISDLSEPENRYEQRDRKLLEVYSSVHAPTGAPMLFEVYFPYATVVENRDSLWRQYRPFVFGAPLLLALLEVWLGWLLARRIRASRSERETLLQHAVDASDAERQRIARDLHDGIVQDLAGVSFAIAGALEQAGPDSDPTSRATLRQAAAATRRGIRQLRTLLVDLYPPNLRREGLESALGDLLARAQSDGIETAYKFDPTVALSEADEELAFRVAQEAMRNTLRHADAKHIEISVGTVDGYTALVVSDDGRGFDPTAARESGHFGLQLLVEAAAQSGSRLDVTSGERSGTRVTLFMGRGS